MSRTRSLRVAVVQFEVTDDVRQNLAKIEKYSRRAKKKHAEFVLFSECCLTGYPPTTGSVLDRRFAVLQEAGLARVKNLARELGLWMIAGLARPSESGWVNSAVAIRPSGRIAETYDKIHLMIGPGMDLDYFEAGRRIPVFKVCGIDCAMLICFDARFPEPFRLLKERGVKVVFMPFYVAGENARWKLPVLEGTLRCRAAENGVFIVASNCSGPDQALLSCVCDPDGVSIGEAKLDKEDMFIIDIEASRVNNNFYGALRKDLFEVRAKRKLKTQ